MVNLKKGLILAFVLIMALNVMVLPALAATTEKEIDPRYPVFQCGECGGTVRFVRHYETLHEGPEVTSFDLYKCLNCGKEYRLNVVAG